MSPSIRRVIMDGVAIIGTWPAFGVLILLCLLLFGHLVSAVSALETNRLS
jgi:hypothetical protein